jgi:hypothetical protein
MKNKLLALIFIIPFISSCAMFQTYTTDGVSVDIVPNTTVTLPSPKELNINKNLSQIVSAKYIVNGKESYFTTHVIATANNKHIIIIALSGWGGTLFKLDYDGSNIISSSLPMPNKNTGVKQSLIEFILSNAPNKVLTKMFEDTNLHIKFENNKRILEDENNTKIIEIDYSKSKNLNDVITIHNYHYNYTVKVTNLDK